MLVEGLGCESYLEFGTYVNETIGLVECPKRFGVDPRVVLGNVEDIHFFQMTTQEFIKGHAEDVGPFDFVFIDADHSAAAVREDFHGIWPHVSPEGIVCLHDTNPESKNDTKPGFCGDAWKFAQELTECKEFECLTLPYHPGLSLIRKRVSWGPA